LLEAFLSVLDEFTAQIETLEATVEETATALEETQLLMTILAELLLWAADSRRDR